MEILCLIKNQENEKGKCLQENVENGRPPDENFTCGNSIVDCNLLCVHDRNGFSLGKSRTYNSSAFWPVVVSSLRD